MAVTFHTEKLDAVIEEVLPMLRRHYEEIAWKKDKIYFNPDLERYHQLEDAGVLRFYVARDDGAIVGYAVFFVTQNLHYKDVKQAQNDIFYVDPSRRGAMIGQKLLRDYAEGELKREGVKVLTLHIKTAHDWHKLAEHWGYEWTERNMHKWIGD